MKSLIISILYDIFIAFEHEVHKYIYIIFKENNPSNIIRVTSICPVFTQSHRDFILIECLSYIYNNIYKYSHKFIGLLSLLIILGEHVELIYLIPLPEVEVLLTTFQ